MLLAAPAARVVIPVMSRLPLSVMPPLAVTFKVPETLEVPRSIVFASVSATLFPLVTAIVLKSFPA